MTFTPGARRYFLVTPQKETIENNRLRWNGFHRNAAAHPRKIQNLHERITYLEFLLLTPWYVRLWNTVKNLLRLGGK